MGENEISHRQGFTFDDFPQILIEELIAEVSNDLIWIDRNVLAGKVEDYRDRALTAWLKDNRRFIGEFISRLFDRLYCVDRGVENETVRIAVSCNPVHQIRYCAE